jgi:hypothetical protein
MIGLCKAWGVYTHRYEDLTFGADCVPLRRYRDIIGM